MGLNLKLIRSPNTFLGQQMRMIVLACVIVLSVSLSVTLVYETYQFKNDSLGRLKTIADMIAAENSAALAFGDYGAVQNSLRILAADETILQLFVFDASQNPVAWYVRGAGDVRPPDLAERAEEVLKDAGDYFFEMSPEVARPVIVDRERLGTVAIEMDGKVFVEKLTASAGIGVAILFVAVFASYLLAMKLGRIVTQPISSLLATIREVADTKNYTCRAQVGGVREVVELSEGFNSMLLEIERRDLQLMARQDKLHKMANYDSLTSLPNRSLFNDRLNQALRHAKRTDERMAVLFIDLDEFKPVNDTYGHKAGDSLLIEVARRLEGITRIDDTVARLGGDEFTVFLQGLKSEEDAQLIANKHLDNLRAPYQYGDKQLFISASIGIAFSPEHGGTAEVLVKSADTAMYHAKSKGKNNIVVFQEWMYGEMSEKLSLQNDLRRVVEKGELVLHYQPRINLKTGKCISLEALVRWRHPERGLIPPMTFIPLAEETGAILKIGEWVLREATRQLNDWHHKGLYIPRVSVNVSPKQFVRQNIVELVKSVVADSKLCFKNLELEITETALMSDMTQSVAILRQLQELGVNISIDDFGTGYSSLSSLRILPISILKVDRSFVMQAHESDDDARILSAIIAMAKSLNLEVVAEGVELARHVELLKKFNCTEAQGYYFAKPMEPEKLKDFLSDNGYLPTVLPPEMACLKSPERASGCLGNRFCRVREAVSGH